MNAPILSLCGIQQTYTSRNASGWGSTTVRAVDGIDLDVFEGETLAIVGESGSGKSTLAKLLLMLTSPTSGKALFNGKDFASLDGELRHQFRREVQAVFQDPASSLNPRMTIEKTLRFIVKRHALRSATDIRPFLADCLMRVGLNPPERYLERYPHELSGGQQQRVAIARAMMMAPKVIVADEPLSSLDVSVQAQILDLMKSLRTLTNVGFVVISHDLGAMRSIADRTAVMYRGRIVEIGENIYTHPRHPYTKLLLDARLTADPTRGRIRSMASAPSMPTLAATPNGCRFRPRCHYAVALCETADPMLRPMPIGQTQVACHRAEELSRHFEIPGGGQRAPSTGDSLNA
ncbi:oligopeptide/dipeptide ABC transporter ATP-binding protein [Rhizobium leguminosarum]|uniref:oligopeptide/dipeptide ABC transporter ATP-binding protein n=1 Tax=Rhizobium leguminosarum TaxID=384 RepID=UPI00103151BC|nr:ABC transporter ATP-binding protein [Rhizobium leguminosarum]NKK61437.1 ATP-binding cassette domain-containing protein [Rhizobium leguminosarum bv. viciae]TAX26840.1 ABC transporter ATP-binding protein [Rhizobium leguminosarum]